MHSSTSIEEHSPTPGNLEICGDSPAPLDYVCVFVKSDYYENVVTDGPGYTFDTLFPTVQSND